MVIYYGDSIREIILKNLERNDNEPIIGVGVDVIVKHFNNDKAFFYKTNIRHLTKEDLQKFVGDWHKPNEYLDRYEVATRANLNIAIKEFQERVNNYKLVEVLESDWYTIRLLNSNIIHEVQGFVFDPRERELDNE